MTEVVIRQRGQLTIPKEIVDAAGLVPGTKIDLFYSNGAIVLRPWTHGGDAARSPESLRRFRGIARGVFGRTPDEVEAWLERERSESDTDHWAEAEVVHGRRASAAS